jgi:hypothetical protein
MTANEYRTALDRLGLTQTGAASLFRADERTSRRWARGERSVQGGVQILIELLLDRTISVRDLERIADCFHHR